MNGKQAAGYRAVEWVEDGMIVGLGTGSTAYWAIERIGKRMREGLRIQAIATSNASERLALQLGIPLISAADIRRIDLTIDGADEVNPEMSLIKGGGGALLREKMVALQSDRFVVIADQGKAVRHLGKFKLPIEVVPFSCEWTLRNLVDRYGVHMEFRIKEDKLFVTDNGNYLIDADFIKIEDPAKLAAELKAITGVVDHGLFIDMADTLVIGHDDGQVTIQDKK